MQSNKKSYDYLESIQKEYLQERFGKTFEKDFQKIKEIENNFTLEKYFDSQPAFSEQEREQLKEEFKKHARPIILPTKYESYGAYSILKTLFESIETTAKKLSLTKKNKVIYGTAQSKEYNAFADKVPETEEYLIVFEGELFTLSNQLAKLVSQCLPDFKITQEGVSFNVDLGRIKNHIQINRILQERFADLVYNAIYRGQPTKTKQYNLKEPFGKLHYTLLWSLELFVVGHEYGHICCGHLDEKNIIQLNVKDKTIERVTPDWEMEYEADLSGLTLLLNSLDKNNLAPFSYLGPELFFTFLDLDERAYSLYSNGTETRSKGSDTHPPTIERRKRIRNTLKATLPKEHLESYERLSNFLENVIELLWEQLKGNTK